MLPISLAYVNKSHQLPPCKAAFSKHIQRANYQAAIWHKCLEKNPETPSPEGHGWTIDNNKVVIDWIDERPAPESLLDLLACSCKNQCKLSTCACMQNGLKCTEMCKLPKCVNWMLEDDEEGDVIEGSIDDILELRDEDDDEEDE